MANKLTFCTIKGGTGKTTLSFNTAWFLSKNAKVLVIDCDPQSNTSSCFNLKNPENQLIDAVKSGDFKDGCYQLTKNLHIIPCGTKTQAGLAGIMGDFDANMKLRAIIKKCDADYDWIVMDTRPSICILTINALMVPDVKVFVPALADQFSFDGLLLIAETIERIKNSGLNNPEIKGVILNKFHYRKNIAQDIQTKIQTSFPGLLLTPIREDVKFSEANAEKKPIFNMKNARGADDLKKLIKQIEGAFFHDAKKAAA